MMATPHEQIQQRLESLIEINRLLMGVMEPVEVITVILESAIRLFQAQGCSLALLDEVLQELAFIAMAGPASVEEFRVPFGQGIAGWVAQTGEAVVSNDVRSDPRFFSGIDNMTGYTTESILCVPLRQHDQVIGVIEALNTTKQEGFTTDDVQLLMVFGGLAGTAISRTQTFNRLRNTGAAFQEIVQDRYRLIIGRSSAMQETIQTARTVAATNTTVLLLGESGTGKEVVARAIHQWSQRAEHPFVAINCVALTPELLASELFGYEKGAFTGATTQKKGKFELADGGTLFLDEIGDLAPDLQTKLLRVLQDKEFQRVGGVKDIRANVRILAATNRDLRQAMQSGAFREDLYYRLNVVTITLPPLRNRREDIPGMVDYFIEYCCREVNRPTMSLTASALQILQAYHWPGNVRELQNVIERAVVLAPGHEISESDFPAEIRQAVGTVQDSHAHASDIDDALPLTEAVNAFKRARILRALQMAGGNQRQAAQLLGIQPSNLSRLMQTLRLRE
jgi:Nif-specific regulatory protein